MSPERQADIAIEDYFADLRAALAVSRVMDPGLPSATELQRRAEAIGLALRAGDPLALQDECLTLAVLAIRAALEGCCVLPARAPDGLANVFVQSPRPGGYTHPPAQEAS